MEPLDILLYKNLYFELQKIYLGRHLTCADLLEIYLNILLILNNKFKF